jgi:hypothetical protein
MTSKKTQWVKGFGLEGCIAKKKGLVASFVALGYHEGFGETSCYLHFANCQQLVSVF